MFSGLFSWFHRKPQRMIFEVWTGEKTKFVDPIVAWDALLRHEGFSWDLATECEHPEDEINLPATIKMAPIVAEVFGVKQLDEESGKGLSAGELYSLLREFVAYVVHVKKKLGTSQTDTAISETGRSETGEPSTMPPSLDLSSGQTESSSDEQAQPSPPSSQPVLTEPP